MDVMLTLASNKPLQDALFPAGIEFAAIFRISGNRIQKKSKRPLNPFHDRQNGEERRSSESEKMGAPS
jgi:hypothetical protein